MAELKLRISIFACFTFLLAVLAAPLAASSVESEVEHDLDFPNNGTIELSNIKGQIEVIGHDEDRVLIWAIKSVDNPADSKELENIDIVVEVENGQLSIETVYKNPSLNYQALRDDSGSDKFSALDASPVNVDYKIYVPRHVNLDICSIKSHTIIDGVTGEIDVELRQGPLMMLNLDGDISIDMASGPLYLENVRGSLMTNRINGKIDARIQNATQAKSKNDDASAMSIGISQ